MRKTMCAWVTANTLTCSYKHGSNSMQQLHAFLHHKKTKADHVGVWVLPEVAGCRARNGSHVAVVYHQTNEDRYPEWEDTEHRGDGVVHLPDVDEEEPDTEYLIDDVDHQERWTDDAELLVDGFTVILTANCGEHVDNPCCLPGVDQKPNREGPSWGVDVCIIVTAVCVVENICTRKGRTIKINLN